MCRRNLHRVNISMPKGENIVLQSQFIVVTKTSSQNSNAKLICPLYLIYFICYGDYVDKILKIFCLYFSISYFFLEKFPNYIFMQGHVLPCLEKNLDFFFQARVFFFVKTFITLFIQFILHLPIHSQNLKKL